MKQRATASSVESGQHQRKDANVYLTHTIDNQRLTIGYLWVIIILSEVIRYMEKDYLIMDDSEYTYGLDVKPEVDAESESIIEEVMNKYNLEEE